MTGTRRWPSATVLLAAGIVEVEGRVRPVMWWEPADLSGAVRGRGWWPTTIASMERRLHGGPAARSAPTGPHADDPGGPGEIRAGRDLTTESLRRYRGDSVIWYARRHSLGVWVLEGKVV